MALLTLTAESKPTLSEAAAMLKVKESDLDPTFGVVMISTAGYYCVRTLVDIPSGFSDPGIGTLK